MKTLGTIFRHTPTTSPLAPLVNVELDDAEKLLLRFKSSFSRDVQVHFVAVWDTVSSVGLVRNKSLPGTTSGMGHVCYFRHALALHERRVKFLPEYSRGSLGPADNFVRTIVAKRLGTRASNGLSKAEPFNDIRTPDDSQTPPMGSVRASSPVHTKEVWFAGSHGEIGGGVYDNLDLNRFGPALRWVSFEGELVGLRLSPSPNEWETTPSRVYRTLQGLWLFLEILPIKRLRYSVAGDQTTRIPHFGRPREIQHNQFIHESALLYLNEVAEGIASKDKTCARLPPGLSWDTLSSDLIEDDPYTAARSFLAEVSKISGMLDERQMTAVDALLRTGPGRRSLKDVTLASDEILIHLLNKYIAEAHKFHESQTPSSSLIARGGALVFQAIIMILIHGLPMDKRQPLDAIKPFASALATYDINLAKRFMFSFGSPQICGPLLSKTQEWFVSLAYFPTCSPLCGSLAVGGDSGTLLVWEPDSGSSRAWCAHQSELFFVAISPDGSTIASASEDCTVRIWNASTGNTINEPLVHSDWVRAIAFSRHTSNGSSLASGVDDGSVHLWEVPSNTEQYHMVASLPGHNDFVRSVAFSADGQYVASGSDDRNIRVWGVQSRKLLGVWRGHTSIISSLAFSRDGRYLASSGAEDHNICLWSVSDLDSAYASWPVDGPPRHVLRGHKGSVNSVAFSPDSTRLVSGSDDRTIIVWDTKTGEITWEPFRCHTKEISCVSFSPDGRRIASCSVDGSVRIWDASTDWWHF